MTETLVDDLEPVDVEQDHRHGLDVRTDDRERERIDDALDQRLAGRQSRDRIAR